MPPTSRTRDIIVVGASSGGLEALRVLVRDVEKDLPAAMFIVLHIGATSHLAQILDQERSLPVVPAKSGQRIEHGKVYVAVPGSHLLLPLRRAGGGPGSRQRPGSGNATKRHPPRRGRPYLPGRGDGFVARQAGPVIGRADTRSSTRYPLGDRDRVPGAGGHVRRRLAGNTFPVHLPGVSWGLVGDRGWHHAALSLPCRPCFCRRCRV